MRNKRVWCGTICVLIICFMFHAILVSTSLYMRLGFFVLGVVCCLMVALYFIILHNREIVAEIRAALATAKDWIDTERLAEAIALKRLREVDWAKYPERKRYTAAELKDDLFGPDRGALVHQLVMLKGMGLVDHSTAETGDVVRDFWRPAPAVGPGRGPWGRYA